MGKFAVGLLLGIVLGAGGALLVLRREAVVTTAEARDAGPSLAREPPRRKRPGAAPPVAAAPVLGAEDLKLVAQGDALRLGPAAVDLGAEGPEPRDLAQAEIDGVIASKAGAITACIHEARGEAVLSGRVTVGLVVAPGGEVKGTRVEGPAYLMRRGLAGCVRPHLRVLRFPAAGKSTVVTVPFDLD